MSRWYSALEGSILGHFDKSSGTKRPTMLAMAPLTWVSPVGLSYTPTTRKGWISYSMRPSPLTPKSLRLILSTFPAESRVAATVVNTSPVSPSSNRTRTP